VCEGLVTGRHVVALARGPAPEREFFLLSSTESESRGYAECIDEIPVAELERLRPLHELLALPWKEVQERFRPERGLRVLALRVYPLRRAVPARPDERAEGGWVDLGREIPVETSGWIFNRTDFRKRLERIQSALGG